MKALLLRTWAGVVLISFSGIFVRLADVEPFRAAFLRGLYALPFLVGWTLWARRGSGRGLGGLFMPVAFVAGALLGADLLAWHESIARIGAGLATVLPNLQVLIIGVLAIFVFGERPRPTFWLALPVVLGGVWILSMVGRPITSNASVVDGVRLGVLTAFFYAGYIMLLRVARLRQTQASAVETMTSATLGLTVVCGIAAALQGVAAPAGDLRADGWLLLLAIGSQVVGWGLLTSSIHKLPAAVTAVALLLQPLLAMIWGASLLDEPIGWPQAAGAAVVLVGVAIAHGAASTPAPAGLEHPA